MRIGTTPTHTFELPSDIVSTVAKVRVIYAQNKEKVLSKETTELEGNNVVFKLTQEETLKFSRDVPVEIQLRVITRDNDCLSSNLHVVSPYICLENEVFV